MKQNAKILVVDDDMFVREMLSEILQSSNYEVDTANDGQEAYDKVVKDSSYELIVSDMNMPEKNGIELIKDLRRDEINIPIIILTGNNEIPIALDAISSGANDYHIKDENIEDTILLSVEKVLEKDRLEKQNIQLMKDLARKNEDLLDANKVKDKFFSIISHDLRNPIGALYNNFELLVEEKDDLTDAERDEFIDIMYDATKNVNALLDNLLEWAQTQSGNISFKPVDTNIYNLATHNISLCKLKAESKKIQLINSVGEESMVCIDGNMITTVIRNLLSNALKFTPEGGSIKISSEISDEMINVSITDSGIGMSKDDLDKLFRIDVHHTTIGTSAEKGTGLGLILCKEFVEKNNGKIWVDSELGKGTSFTFSLPVKQS